jgi:hypothetical protein
MLLAAVLAACNGQSTQDAAATSQNDQPASVTPSTSPSQLSLDASTYAVTQNAGAVTINVARTGPASTAIDVSYSTSDGTAVAGTDYTSTSGTLQWSENDSTPKTISVPVNNATPFSGSKTFQVVLTAPSSAATIANPGNAIVTISGDASPAIGDLQLGSPTYQVAQSSGSLTVSVQRVGGTSGAASVSYATSNGTANAGTDYTATSGTIQWPDGDATTRTFTVAISNASPFSGAKTFNVGLSSSVGAALGTPSSSVVTVAGSSSAPVGTVQFTASSYAISQSAGSVTVSAQRVGGTNGSASVSYATQNGTASAGTDYTATKGTLQWADGDATAKTFAVNISNASPFSGAKSFNVALSSPSAGATISNPGSTQITINGDAASPAGTVALSASTSSVAQNAGQAVLTVNRSGGLNGTISVAYATANGTATAGADYTATSGTLQWASGDTSARSISIPVSNANPFSGTKNFKVALSSPTGGAGLGTPSSTTVSIAGGAAAAVGSLQFSTAIYTVAQSAGSLQVTVNRTGGSNGAVSVSYGTSDGTAIAGTDYTAASGTLSWQSGNAASQTFTVPISNAAAFIGSKAFSITLSSPTGGATLVSPSSATASISGSNTGGTAWVYYNGVMQWAGDWSSAATPNYQDTAGQPLSGPYDVAVTVSPNSTGLWQPFINGNCQTNTSLCFDTSSYQHLVFSLKPTVAGAVFAVAFESSGDTKDGNTLEDISAYCSGGSNPPVNQWETCSIPMSAFALTDKLIVKFFIQWQVNGPNTVIFYADNVGFTNN